MGDDMEKAGLKMDHDRLVYHSLKEGGQSRVGSGDLCCVFVPEFTVHFQNRALWPNINS